jgi:hypothetical protein
MRKCASNVDCMSYSLCVNSCSTLDCRQSCDRAYPGFELGLSEATRECSDECASGRNWSCIGNVSWKSPKSADVTLTVDIKYNISGQPADGIQVAVCGVSDDLCRTPRASGASDEAGHVAQLMFTNSNSLVPHAGFEGYLSLTGTDIVPARWYWGFPLTEERYDLNDGPVIKHGLSVLRRDDSISSLLLSHPEERGAIVASTLDCQAGPAAGVVIDIEPHDPNVRIGYGFSTGLTETDSMALAFISDVPAGRIDVIAVPTSAGAVSSRQTVVVSAGALTFVSMTPTQK